MSDNNIGVALGRTLAEAAGQLPVQTPLASEGEEAKNVWGIIAAAAASPHRKDLGPMLVREL